MISQASSFILSNCIAPVVSSTPVAVGMGGLCAIPGVISAAITKINHFVKSVILRPLKWIQKAFTLIVHAISNVGKAAFKIAGACGKIFTSMIKHPLIGVGVLAVTALALGALMYPGAAGAVVGGVGFVVKTVFSAAGTLICRIPQVVYHIFSAIGHGASQAIGPVSSLLAGTVKAVGTVISYVPTILYQLVSGIGTIARFILRI